MKFSLRNSLRQMPTISAQHRHVTESNRLEQLSSGLIAFWRYPALSLTWVRVCLILGVAAACLIRARIGLAGTQIFSHDAFMLLDGAWRMLNGQRPHVDFYSHLGVLTYAPTALGLLISHDRAQGFGYAHGLVGLVLAVWAYALGRRRLADVPLALMCLAVAFMATDPSSLGFSPLKVGPAMTYNRHGYVLIALLLIEAFRGSYEGKRRDEWWGGFSTGVIVVSLFFLKITYCIAAVFLLIALVPCRVQRRARWIGLITSFVTCSILFCSYFGFNMMPMLHDLVTVAQAKHIRVDFYLVNDTLCECATLFSFTMAAALLLLKWRAKGHRSVIFAGVAVCLMGTAQVLGNYEQSGFPMAVFVAILVIDALNVSAPEPPHSTDLFHAAVLLFGSAFVVASLLSGGTGLANGLVQKFYTAPYCSAMQSSVLYGFVPVEDDAWYSGYVNDGLALLRKYRRSDESVMSLDFTNPFSYGLGARPAPGGTTVLQYETTFDDRHRESAQQLFGFADLVMLPKGFSDPTLFGSIPRLYGAYLESHFSKVAESGSWRLYRRR